MSLKERIAKLHNDMGNSINNGASYEVVRKYEIELEEIIIVSNWIKEQCIINNVLYFEKKTPFGIAYFKFKNDTPFDFKYIRLKVDILNKPGKFYFLLVDEWKKGDYRKLYFNDKPQPDDELSINPENIEYII